MMRITRTMIVCVLVIWLIVDVATQSWHALFGDVGIIVVAALITIVVRLLRERRRTS